MVYSFLKMNCWAAILIMLMGSGLRSHSQVDPSFKSCRSHLLSSNPEVVAQEFAVQSLDSKNVIDAQIIKVNGGLVLARTVMTSPSQSSRAVVLYLEGISLATWAARFELPIPGVGLPLQIGYHQNISSGDLEVLWLAKAEASELEGLRAERNDPGLTGLQFRIGASALRSGGRQDDSGLDPLQVLTPQVRSSLPSVGKGSVVASKIEYSTGANISDTSRGGLGYSESPMVFVLFDDRASSELRLLKLNLKNEHSQWTAEFSIPYFGYPNYAGFDRLSDLGIQIEARGAWGLWSEDFFAIPRVDAPMVYVSLQGRSFFWNGKPTSANHAKELVAQRVTQSFLSRDQWLFAHVGIEFEGSPHKGRVSLVDVRTLEPRKNFELPVSIERVFVLRLDSSVGATLFALGSDRLFILQP